MGTGKKHISAKCKPMLNMGVCMQATRLDECERMLVAMDLAMWLNDGISALQAVVICYGLLTPLIFHQVKCSPVVEVWKKLLLNVMSQCQGLIKPLIYGLYLFRYSKNVW